LHPVGALSISRLVAIQRNIHNLPLHGESASDPTDIEATFGAFPFAILLALGSRPETPHELTIALP
jgi:hypothetical protein